MRATAMGSATRSTSAAQGQNEAEIEAAPLAVELVSGEFCDGPTRYEMGQQGIGHVPYEPAGSFSRPEAR